MKFSGAPIGNAHNFGAGGGEATSGSVDGAGADCISTPSANYFAATNG
jgi:hypothetical protein